MTQEEKQLLIQDLCARLAYRTICEDIHGNSGILFSVFPELNAVTLKISELGSTWTTDIDKIKPYLRPMSSMTEEELDELLDGENSDFDGKSELVKRAMTAYIKGDKLLSNELFSMQCAKTIDWLNAHHFDYRGLIEKGLALEAPENIYNTKTK